MKDRLEVIAEDNNLCGEGPIWDPARRRLIWNDCSSRLVYQFVPATGEKTILSRGLRIAGIALNRTGDLIFAGNDGCCLWRGPDQVRTFVTQYHDEPLIFNDILAGPKGDVYAGTYYWDQSGMLKHGRLYRIDRKGSIRVVDEGIELSNGLGFSPDDKVLYYADSSARKIYAYDVEEATGALANKRMFVSVPATEGLPDGLTVDKEGYVWSAQWYGAQVVRYDPDGAVERRIEMPVQQVSSVAFGGEDGTHLYITTAAESWPSPLAPPGYDFKAPNMGGSLYRLRLDIQGKPEHQADWEWSGPAFATNSASALFPGR